MGAGFDNKTSGMIPFLSLDIYTTLLDFSSECRMECPEDAKKGAKKGDTTKDRLLYLRGLSLSVLIEIREELYFFFRKSSLSPFLSCKEVFGGEIRFAGQVNSQSF